MKKYKSLKIWQQGIEIVKLTYLMTKLFPSSEKYNLVSQMNRSAVSIPSNIAEGSSRNRDKDYHRFIEIALGSCFELDTQCEIVKQLDLVSEDKIKELMHLLEEEGMMLQGFMSKLRSH